MYIDYSYGMSTKLKVSFAMFTFKIIIQANTILFIRPTKKEKSISPGPIIIQSRLSLRQNICCRPTFFKLVSIFASFCLIRVPYHVVLCGLSRAFNCLSHSDLSVKSSYLGVHGLQLEFLIKNKISWWFFFSYQTPTHY